MRFGQDFIEKVREANDIAEVIGQYTELKGTGHRLMGRCPFPDHSDKSPSFSVTSDNQLYYCYGCKKGGNLFTFLETFNGMNFPEAVEFLARRANIPLPEPEPGSRDARASGDREARDLLLKVNRATAVYFHHNLKGAALDSPVRQYLVRRGLTEEIVEKFRLGYSTDEWQGLGRHLVAKGVPLSAMEKLQLIKPKKSQGGLEGVDRYFDLFRARLMFPIFGPNGDTLGFGGRVLDDGLPKYVNSADSPVFHKSKVLYGLHETGKFIRAQDEVIVVEGYMDAIALYAAGFKNVVAILGTAMTPDHARLIKRYTSNVKMLLDGDEAGINAAEKSLPVLLAGGLMPKGLILPDGMDPDEFIRAHGPEAMRTELDRAPELFNVLLSKRWLSNYHGSDSEKVAVVSEAAVALGQMANRPLMELYLLELARQLDVDIGWVRRAVASATAAAPARRSQPTPNSSGGPNGPAGAGSAGGSQPGPFAGSGAGPSGSVGRSTAGQPGRSPANSGASRPDAARPLSRRPPGHPASAGSPGHPASAGSAPGSSAGQSGRPPANPAAAGAGAAGAGAAGGADVPPDLGFAPPEAELASYEDDGSGDPGELTVETPTLVSFKGAPKDESIVLSLLLYNEQLMRELVEAGPENITKMISHAGIRQVLDEAVRRYQVEPGKFASLAPQLANEVDQPALLASSLPMTSHLTQDGAEKKLMADYLNAIQKRWLKAQGKSLVSQLKERPTAEALAQVQALQRNRLGKDD